MFTRKINNSYNPIPFFNSNVRSLLSDNISEVISVRFSGFLKKPFQSGVRPIGTLKIIYKDRNAKCLEKKVLIKYYDRSGLAFDTMEFVYQKLENTGLHSKLPMPLSCDRENSILFLEFVEGIGLKFYIAKQLLKSHYSNTDEALNVFYGIGRWLADYHKELELKEKLNLGEYIAEVKTGLINSFSFTMYEKQLLTRLLHDFESDYGDNLLSLTRPHNDFAIRNIILTKNRTFYVIDWDAMVHIDFSEKASIWNDITYFYLNIQSFIRFSPLANKKNLIKLSESFINGYFDHNSTYREKDISRFIWFFSMAFYVGLIGDRSLPEIYKNGLSRRYRKQLHKALLLGSASIINNV